MDTKPQPVADGLAETLGAITREEQLGGNSEVAEGALEDGRQTVVAKNSEEQEIAVKLHWSLEERLLLDRRLTVIETSTKHLISQLKLLDRLSAPQEPTYLERSRSRERWDPSQRSQAAESR